ncbi:docking protein 1 [Eublepharis macularius]|uniref:Docking protein 1 n=1 Tax=Eublepharis macularius TaxID=481883 RepID=A0AA97L952_EUBMA|nr:docking protein 1 [Eublepharis macularius]
MDPPLKAGPLLLQQPPGLRLGAKRWKKGWFVLFPASPHGVARLEFFDCKEGATAADRVGTKRLDKKIVRLADCVSVAPVPDSFPKVGLAVFRLETSERTYLFAAQPQDASEWVAKLCEAAFLGNSGKGAPLATEPGGQRPLEMATNSIYYSRDEASEFWVTVQKTEAAERCQLHGVYVLKASRDSLVLRDPHSGQPLHTWPYRLLRRYGRDKVMFSFEAGRRCESGPGNFTFETKQGNEIFRVVEAAIQDQKAQAEEDRQSASSLNSEASSVAQIQSAIASALLLGGECPPAERQVPRGTPSAKLSLAMEEKEAALSSLRKGQNGRDPLPQWPSTPPRSPLSGLACHPLPPEDTGSVYSEPLDAVKGFQYRPDPLYADPLDSRRHSGGEKEEAELGGTSVLYEQVGSALGSCQGTGVHIYDEPEGRAPRPIPAPAPTPIYDEAHLLCEAWRTQGLESRAGYELPYQPGAGDYAVPAFHQKAGLKPSKPSPAPKPPRAHKKPTQPGSTNKPSGPPVPGWATLKNGSSSSNNNNSNNNNNNQADREPIYSRVLKPSRTCPGPAGREQSVDECRPASVYEDLGEI